MIAQLSPFPGETLWLIKLAASHLGTSKNTDFRSSVGSLVVPLRNLCTCNHIMNYNKLISSTRWRFLSIVPYLE